MIGNKPLNWLPINSIPAELDYSIADNITDAQYQNWLAAEADRCLLIEIQCWVDGAEIIERISSLRYATHPSDDPANTPYAAILAEAPEISLTNESPLGVADVQVWNLDGSRDSWLDRIWSGGRMVWRLGDPSWPLADFRTIFAGVADGITGNGAQRLAIKGRDRKELLNRPIQTRTFPTDTPNAKSPVPLCLGLCYNVPGIGALAGSVAVRSMVVTATYAGTGNYAVSVVSGIPHGFFAGDEIIINGASPSWANGVFEIYAILSPTAFECVVPGGAWVAITGNSIIARRANPTLQFHDGAIQAVASLRDKGAAGEAFQADYDSGKITLTTSAQGAITADVWGAATGSPTTTTVTASYVSSLTWEAVDGPATITAVYYDGDSITGWTANPVTGRVSLPATAFVVTADVVFHGAATQSASPVAPLIYAAAGVSGSTFAAINAVRVAGSGVGFSVSDLSLGRIAITSIPATAVFALITTNTGPFASTSQYLQSVTASGSLQYTVAPISGETLLSLDAVYMGLDQIQFTTISTAASQIVFQIDGLSPPLPAIGSGPAVEVDVTFATPHNAVAATYYGGLTWTVAIDFASATTVYLGGESVGFTADAVNNRVTFTAPPATITADIEVYSATTADLVQSLVTRPMPPADDQEGTPAPLLQESDIDGDNFDAFRVLQPAPVGLFISNTQRNAVQALDEIMAGVGGRWGFTRLGLLRLWRLDAPTGDPVAEYDADDVLQNGIRPLDVEAAVRRIQVGCRRNYTQQDKDSLADTVADADRERYAAEYLLPPGEAVNAGVADTNPGAEAPGVLPSLFLNQADAQDEAERLAALRAVPRKLFEVDFRPVAFGHNQGDLILLDHPRFGFAGGALAVVVGIKEAPSLGQVTLTLWR